MNLLVIIIFLGLSIVIFFLFFYIAKLENRFETKFILMESDINDINKEIKKIRKILNSINENSNKNKEIEEIENIIEDLINMIKSVDYKYKEKIIEVDEKINSIKEILKSTMVTNETNRNFNERIIEMYKDGFTIEDISKELGIPPGEIDFVIKMNFSKS